MHHATSVSFTAHSQSVWLSGGGQTNIPERLCYFPPLSWNPAANELHSGYLYWFLPWNKRKEGSENRTYNCIWLKWETWDAFILQEKKNKTFREFNRSNLDRTTSKALEGCARGICRFRKILAVLTLLRETVVAKCYISTSMLTNLNQYFPITSLALDLYLFLILS